MVDNQSTPVLSCWGYLTDTQIDDAKLHVRNSVVISGGSALLSVAAATSGGNSGASSPSVSSSKKFFLSTDRLKAFAADAAHKLKKESSITETQSELLKKSLVTA